MSVENEPLVSQALASQVMAPQVMASKATAGLTNGDAHGGDETVVGGGQNGHAAPTNGEQHDSEDEFDGSDEVPSHGDETFVIVDEEPGPPLEN